MLQRITAAIGVLLALLLFTAVVADAKPKSQRGRFSSLLIQGLGGDVTETKFRRVAGHLRLSDAERSEFLGMIGNPDIDYATGQTVYQVVVSKKRVAEDYSPVSGDRTEMSFVYRLSTGREVWTVVDSNEFGLRTRTTVHQDVVASVAKTTGVTRVTTAITSTSETRTLISGASSSTSEDIIATASAATKHGDNCQCEGCRKRRTGKVAGSGQDHGKDSNKGTFDPFNLTAWGSVYFGEGEAGSGSMDEEVGYNFGAKGRYYFYQNGPYGVGAWGTIQHGGAGSDTGENSWTKAGGGSALRYKGERIDDKLDLGAVVMWSDFESRKNSFEQDQASLLGHVSNYTLLDGRRKDGKLLFPDLQVWLTGEAQLAVLNHERRFNGKRIEDDPQDFGRLDATAKLGLYDFYFGCEKEYRLTPQLVLGATHEAQKSRSYGRIGAGLEGAHKDHTIFDFAATFRKALGNGGKSRVPLELSLDIEGIRGMAKSASITQPTAQDYDINARRTAKANAATAEASATIYINGDK